MIDHLLLDTLEPVLCRNRLRQLEVRPAQFFGLVDRRQGLEKLDARREVVDRETGIRFEHDAAGDRSKDVYAQRAEFGNGELDAEAAGAGDREGALDADEEHPLLDRRLIIKCVDHRAGGVELDNAADQASLDLSAEKVALHGHADRSDVGDREFAVQQLFDVDHHAFDRSGELEAADALQAGNAGGKGQLEQLRMTLDVFPGDADLVDLDRQPGRPLEAGAAGRPDADEHAEAGFRDESAVAEEGEVAGFATEHQGTDRQLGTDRAEAHHLLVGCRRRVDEDIRCIERKDRADRDAQRVDLEHQALDLAMLEFEGDADGLGIRYAGRNIGLSGKAVADGRGNGLAREQLGAARCDEYRAVEVDCLAEGDLEVGHADAQVVEFQDTRKADLAGTAGGLGRVRATTATRLVDELRLADVEAVNIDNQPRVAVVGIDHSRDAERREGDGGLLHHQQPLAGSAIVLRLVVRIPVENDAAARDLEDIRDLDF